MNILPASHASYRFKGFTLSLAHGALRVADGTERPLRPKSFALLQLFVENAGRLLDRDTIMAAIWPDVFVTDDSITQCVGEIRRALGEAAPRLLQTLPRRGYRFTGEVVANRDRGRQRHAAIPNGGGTEPSHHAPSPSAGNLPCCSGIWSDRPR